MSPDRHPAGLVVAPPPAATLGEPAGALVVVPWPLEVHAKGIAAVQEDRGAVRCGGLPDSAIPQEASMGVGRGTAAGRASANAPLRRPELQPPGWPADDGGQDLGPCALPREH